LASVQPVCDLTPTTKTGAIEGRDEAMYLRAWSYGALADIVIAAAGDTEVLVDSDEGRQIARHHAEMESTYRRLISEYPASDFSRDAMLELGQHLFNLSSYPEAKKWFSALRERLEKSDVAVSDPKRGANLLERSVYGLAFVSFEEGDYVEARVLFDEVAKQVSSELAPRAVFQSARSWMLSRADREAVKRFERIVTELKPRASEYYEESLLRLGECHHRLQEYDKAAEVLARLLTEFPNGDLRHEARFALGFAQQYLNKFDDAVKTFRQVVTDTPGVVGSRAQYHIGECFMDQKKYREAAREFLVVVANFDFEGGYRDWFRRALLSAGLAYQADGDAKAARQQWKELLERFSESPEAKAAKQRLSNADGESKKTN
jgi:TolA-binding protein